MAHGVLLDQREPDLLAYHVIGPDLRHAHRELHAEAPRGVNDRRWHIEVQVGTKQTEAHPLGPRLELSHRLDGFNLDHTLKLPGLVRREQDKVRIERGIAHANRRGQRRAWVDADFELSFVLRLQQADDPIVLKLLTDGSHQDWAQLSLRGCHSPAAQPPENWLTIARRSLTLFIRRPNNGPVHPDTAVGALRVLIVDDDPSVTDTFARMLRLDGFEVWAALSADHGLLLAQAHRPHAILLDLRMPLASGLQFLRAVRAIPGLAHTPVAIVTGDYYVDDAHTQEIAALGAELRYKPLWLDELVNLARGLAGPMSTL